jgi:DNA-binding XRE family transcriptional regulator
VVSVGLSKTAFFPEYAMSHTRDTNPKTIDDLANIFFQKGDKAAKKVLSDLLDDKHNYNVITPSDGKHVWRKTVSEEEDGTKFTSFSPPAFWEAPYSILQVEFQPVSNRDASHRDEFMHHGGEEILLPTSGKIRYRFYWNDKWEGGGTGRPGPTDLGPVRKGDIIRINPQVPHQTWAEGNQPAVAWMVFRDVSNEPAAISVNDRFPKDRITSHGHARATIEELDRPWRYALITWGISEKIRLHRERAGLRIDDLAFACGFDRAHISRIEDAETNPTLEKLIKMARMLHIDLKEFLDYPPWRCRVGNLKADQRPLVSSFLCPDSRHSVHLAIRNILPGSESSVCELGEKADGYLSSWIVLEGGVKVEIQQEKSARPDELWLPENSVIHFRGRTELTIQTLSVGCQILTATFSSVCKHKKATPLRGLAGGRPLSKLH